MTENKKLGFHILADNEQFEDFFMEAKKEGIERGLNFRTSINISEELLRLFEKASKQGYFPVGMVLDGYNLELLFKRHPKQQAKHRFAELKGANDRLEM